MKLYYTILLFTISSILFAQNYTNSFTQVWEDTPWGSGGLTPAGAVWSLDGMEDFDGDGLGEFFLSSSWSGSIGNDAMLYESTGNNAFQMVWYYWFDQLDVSNANYSSITSGDLDGDGNGELVVLIDCLSGQDGLYVFEYDPTGGNFPQQPTATWNINLPGGIEEACDIAVENIDNDPRPELIMSLYSRDPAASHLIVAELAQGSTLSNPNWHIEMDDDTTLTYYAYLAHPTDLDQDGAKEIVMVEWNYTHLIIFENTAEDSYQLANDFFLTFEPLGFSNQGAAEIDIDDNGYNELFLASTAGYFWVATNSGDVSQMTFANNFHLLKNYKSEGGFSLTQVKAGNADTPLPQTPDGGDIYVMATDTNATTGVVYDWEYQGGDVTDPASYNISTVYSDNVSGGQLFKPSKMGIGDFDGDAKPEIAIGSFSFAQNKPHIVVTESDAETGLNDGGPSLLSPQAFDLKQNYPNPFNPRTTIELEVRQSAPVTLTIYNSLGQKIKSLFSGKLNKGTHPFTWDGKNDRGAPVPSGIYFYELKSEKVVQTRKMILMR